MTTRLLRLPDIPINAVIVQQLTLWIAMLGGCLAARSQRLLGISSMELLPNKWRPPVRVFTNAILAAVCVCLAYSSQTYLQSIHGEELFRACRRPPCSKSCRSDSRSSRCGRSGTLE